MPHNNLADSPCGYLVPTDEGQQAYVPHPLPRELDMSMPLINQLDAATRAVANLAGVGETVQNPHLLIRPFLRREAVLSSRIEGTQASLSDLFLYEAGGSQKSQQRTSSDVEEVVNYVRAVEYGIERLDKLPISVRLMNEVHALLLQGVRGNDKSPGELRTRQVWVAPIGTPIEEAKFIPPPHYLLRDLLGEWEKFVNESGKLPLLVQCALMHYQIETIHPYLDGNGRIGRLLITLFLYEKKLLTTPLLYLSAYFERDRQRYYDELYRVSATGDFATWLFYFLKGVAEQAQDALNRVRSVRELQEKYRQILHDRRDSGNGVRLLDLIFAQLFMSVSGAATFLNVSHAGARGVLDRLCNAGVIEYIPGTWPRLYGALDLIREINPPD